jgi:hypothetical protein
MKEDLRSEVGAPEHDEEQYCVCGELLAESASTREKGKLAVGSKGNRNYLISDYE